MTRQPTSWFYRMPWHAEAPALSAQGRTIDRVAMLDGGASRAVTLTLLDTPEEHLLRARVRLAWRVSEAGSSWYVWGESWQPWLPAAPSASMSSDSELPDEIADMVRPFTRGATLAPVARVSRVRSRYGLLDEAGETIGLLSDDRITLRHRGETAGRVREVTVDVTKLGAQAREALATGIEAAGGSRVDGFADLFARAEMAVPLPAPTEFAEDASLAQFVSSLFAGRLHALIVAALTVRSGQVGDATPVVTELTELCEELHALRGLLEPGWCDAQRALADALVPTAATQVHFRGDFAALLDALDAAVRRPPLDAQPGQPAREAFGARLRSALCGLDEAAETAMADRTGLGSWPAVLSAAHESLLLAEVVRPVIPKGGRMLKTLAKVLASAAAAQPTVTAPTQPQLHRMDPAQAYSAGRAVERSVDRTRAARARFEDHWPHWRGQISKHLAEPHQTRP